MGTPVVALCGKVWVPSRAPEKFPVCPECKEIWESMKPGGDGDGRGRGRVTGRPPPGPEAVPPTPALTPAWPERAAWGTAPLLRAWQTAALTDYVDALSRATTWRSRRPAPARRRSRCRRPPSCSDAGSSTGSSWWRRPSTSSCSGPRPRRAPASRSTRRTPPGPGRTSADFVGRRGDLRRGRGEPARDAHPHRALQDAGDPRRGPPRGRRAVVGRGGARVLRAGDPAAGADRYAVPLRHQPDPVRHLRARRRRRSRARSPTSPTATATRWPTTSYARCSSWPTPATSPGARAPATRWPPGSASR